MYNHKMVSDLNKKIKLKGETYTYKTLILSIPTKYECKFFLSDINHIVPNVLYKFIVNIKTVTKMKNNKILINGTIFDKQIKIIHSIKLYNYFLSQLSVNLCGKFENDTCFFPEIVNITKATNDISPVYSSFTKAVEKHIKEAIDMLPEELKIIFNKIHFPESINAPNEALSQLLLFELAIFFQIIFKLKKERKPYQIFNIKTPFKLTESQEQTWQDITSDFKNNYRSIRVIHGDVGSGKTLMAYMAAMQVAKNGKNVVILAPTGILADQIYRFFIENNYENFKICLIVATTTKKNKLEEFKQNQIFIGTHALLYNDYVDNLGLLIIDEQHKFGVNQRNSLLKNNFADVLMLTATVIPRTFQMMSKGYMEFSEIKNTPSNTKRNTFVISSLNIDHVFTRMFNIAMRHKVIWICKTIELAIERKTYFETHIKPVFLIHGKIKEKNDILKEFDKLQQGILISTTVIEVGVDIDINFIFIEEADMFGLAQLHQMRGRVGRRGTDGYCFLIGKNIQKLKQIKKADDGFAITELDSSKRGGGMIHGVKQSGFNSFKFAKAVYNGKVIEIDISDEILNQAKNTTVSEEVLSILGDFEITDFINII